MRWAQWLRQRLEAALSCFERHCQRQCVHIDAHFDDSFEITSLVSHRLSLSSRHCAVLYSAMDTHDGQPLQV